MEDKLISARALLERAKHYSFAIRNDCHPYDAVRIQGEAFRQMVEEAPAVKAVQIPCDLGQKIYEVVLVRDGGYSHINPMTVVGIHVGAWPKYRGHKRKDYLCVTYPTSEVLGRIPLDKIGKTVFTTLEEAKFFADTVRDAR